jgi:carboxymethylenebutenolidase
MNDLASQLEISEHVCANGMPAWITRPKAPGKYPVVVLMHERYGLVQHTLDLSQRCAIDGFLVVTPSFFFRHHDLPNLNKGEGRYDMTDPESVELIDAAFALAKTNDAADMSRIAVAGYCQTGRHPLVYASQRRLTAAVVWYGACSVREWGTNERQPKKLEDVLAAVDCPVFSAFGEADHIISLDDVRKFRGALEDAGKTYEMHVYPGAPHGWLNDTMPGRYRAPQANAGWSDQQAFLKKVMAPGYRQDSITWHFVSESSPSYDFSKNVRLE